MPHISCPVNSKKESRYNEFIINTARKTTNNRKKLAKSLQFTVFIVILQPNNKNDMNASNIQTMTNQAWWWRYSGFEKVVRC